MADYKGQVEFDETKIPVFEVDNDDFTLTLYNLNYGHDYVINVNDTQCDTRNGTQGGAQDKLQKQIFDRRKSSNFHIGNCNKVRCWCKDCEEKNKTNDEYGICCKWI